MIFGMDIPSAVAALSSSKIWKNRGDRAVVSKLMEEHEDGIENRIGLASMTKNWVVATQRFFVFSPRTLGE